MSFFLRNKTNANGSKHKSVPVKRQAFDNKAKKRSLDEDISSHSESENEDSKVLSGTDDDEEETVQEKRLRLTKEYLKEIENQGNFGSEIF